MLAVLFDYRLYHAPLVLSPTTSAAQDNISTPFRVLDIGCGTGIWAMDFAEAWPRVMVNGIGKCGRRGPPHVLDSADPSCCLRGGTSATGSRRRCNWKCRDRARRLHETFCAPDLASSFTLQPRPLSALSSQDLCLLAGPVPTVWPSDHITCHAPTSRDRKNPGQQSARAKDDAKCNIIANLADASCSRRIGYGGIWTCGVRTRN